ncbi:DUF1376 domain-containing protein [Chitinasiproducens palmae]|uniref:DUF1376 domain-containing protein n=1 Tax=Chitinasiproducens palmae TaxID=1770053 RepID=A0A1H2PRU8_9BURK|nr:DUF1376 domain-containing protein [Chitinasiproducens palmae]SDV49222.1 Protein of unknown function [Chitinasiproducens palmae]
MNTAPLTPPDCDLRDFAFMPLDVVRLRDSDLSIHANGEEFRAAVLLWCASWHQMPAASLPDDDATLSSLAGYGRVQKEWKKVRAGALRGWVKCSDGRLYHPVVAEKARDAWTAKLRQRFKTECARIKKHCQRHRIEYAEPDFDQWVSDGCPVGSPLPVPKTNEECPRDTFEMSQGHIPPVPREIHSKGQGEGEGQGEFKTISKPSSSSVHPARGSDDWTPDTPADWCRHFAERHGVEINPSSVHDRKKAWPIFTAWCAAKLSARFVDAAVAAAQRDATEPIAFLPGYVDRVLASQRVDRPQRRTVHDQRAENIAGMSGRLSTADADDPFTIEAEVRHVR